MDNDFKPHAIATGIVVAGIAATIALHVSGDIDKAKQAATATVAVVGTALVFSRNQ